MTVAVDAQPVTLRGASALAGRGASGAARPDAMADSDLRCDGDPPPSFDRR